MSYLSSYTIYVTDTDMAGTLAQFLSFRTRDSGSKEIKITTSMSMLRAKAKQTESVGSVRVKTSSVETSLT